MGISEGLEGISGAFHGVSEESHGYFREFHDLFGFQKGSGDPDGIRAFREVFESF